MLAKDKYLWTQSQLKEIENLWESGLSAREIGKKFGVTRGAIKGVFHRYGITKIPIKRTCVSCGKSFYTTNTSQQKYCSEKCNYREYRKRNEGIRTARQRKWKASFRKLWGYSDVTNTKLAERSERFAAKKLELSGFKDIIVTKDFSDNFAFDIMAKTPKGELCAIDVTTSWHKTMKRGPFGLLRYLGFLKFFVFHIKPDFAWHHLSEVSEHKKSSTCWGAYSRFLRMSEMDGKLLAAMKP